MKVFIRVCIIVVLAALGVLTFVSRTVYHRNLPRVSEVWTTVAYVPVISVHDTALTVYNAWRVADVNVAVGERVFPGRRLMEFCSQAFDLQRRELELEIKRLEYALENTGESTGENAIFIAYALEIARDKLALHMAAAPPPGGLVSTVEAQIINMNTAPGRYTIPGTPLMTLRETNEITGILHENVLPVDAVHYIPFDGYFVFAIEERRGILGPENYVRAVAVTVHANNGQMVAITTQDGVDMTFMTLARDVEGFITGGSTVWVRER